MFGYTHTIPTKIATDIAIAIATGMALNGMYVSDLLKQTRNAANAYKHTSIKRGWNSDRSTNEIIWHSNTIIVHERQCDAMQCNNNQYVVQCLYSRTFPRIPFNLHHSGLFMREGHLAFFVEAVLLEITDNPTPC